MGKMHHNFFNNYTKQFNNNISKNTKIKLPTFLETDPLINIYDYSRLNKEQRISFKDFNSYSEDLSLSNRICSNQIGFQEPRRKSTSLFLATPQKVVGYVTLQFQTVDQYGYDIPKQDRCNIGLNNEYKIAVIKCLAVDKAYCGKGCGTTLFALAVDSILMTSAVDSSIKFIAWDALESAESFYTQKIGFPMLGNKVGKYNFMLKLH